MTFLKFEMADKGLTPTLQKLPKSIQDVVHKVVAETTKRAAAIAKFKTPVDTGNAIDGWVVEKPGRGNNPKGAFVNRVPYINVLEFGGYPVRKGPTFGGRPPGPRTMTAPSGDPAMKSNVSRQAPRGMVRLTLIEIEPQFLADLEEQLQLLINRGG